MHRHGGVREDRGIRSPWFPQNQPSVAEGYVFVDPVPPPKEEPERYRVTVVLR
ncbi:hypothetical protein [Nonomuraea sp. NPDC049709]|uniref:hypothetical protein n=1 Tax=Nonomuraea sp. NPDC049709 TaxID=3154736 RepID=UPI00341761E0